MGTTLKENDRVYMKTIEGEGWGRVVYIDRLSYSLHHTFPIQLELDQPYDDSGQTIYRVSLLDIVQKEDALE